MSLLKQDDYHGEGFGIKADAHLAFKILCDVLEENGFNIIKATEIRDLTGTTETYTVTK